MITILTGLMLIYIAFSTGRRGLCILKPTVEPAADILISSALGLCFLAYAVLILGLLGVLTPPVLWGMTGLLLLFSLFNLKKDFGIFKNALADCKKDKSLEDYLICSLGLLSFIAAFISVLAPETANDSLCYHLNLPKLYLSQGSIRHTSFDYNSEFPLLMEMLYTLGLGLGSSSLAKFFHLVSGFLTAGMAGVMVTRLSGMKRYGKWIFVFLLTTPVIFNQLSTTYVDVGLACFSFFSLMCLMYYLEADENETNFLILAGIFAGFALSIKYLALIVVGIEALLIFSVSIKRSPGKSLRNLLLFAVPIFLCSSYWYIRAYLTTGNPVYPYFYQIFKSGNPIIQYNDIGVPKKIASFLTVFWTLTMKPGIFEGFGVQIGPGYLAFLPLSFLAIKKNRQNSQFVWLWIFSVLFLTAWFLLGQSLRFLVPALPVLAVLVGLGLSSLKENISAKSIRALFVMVIVLHTGFAFYHTRRDFKVALGRETSANYLHRYERSYDLAEFVNKNLPADSLIMNVDETHMFYFQRKLIRESTYVDMGQHYWEGAVNSAQVIRNLKTRGFSHILYSKRLNGFQDQPLRLPAMLENDKNNLASVLNPLYSYEFTDTEGEKTFYTLYQIK